MSKMIYVIRESPNCLIAGKYFYFTGTTHLEHRLRKMIKLKKKRKVRKILTKISFVKLKCLKHRYSRLNVLFP